MATAHTRGTQVAHDTIIPMSTRSVLGPHGVSDLVGIAMVVMGEGREDQEEMVVVVEEDASQIEG
ncbi:uncharacterized protein N7506_001514 [Penicillium brevicompactum]|uniref:uncharacterized protein n=1 Tax=Penicillium brevicompactum TaxID=5074 RepID=UPI002540D75E|nr:uncharacterized protein N7506_001514 [Penicillium brevicompactum]KAJ5348261.1 hypothetical protein N7506_001514 [Penicillium brevicompactum]